MIINYKKEEPDLVYTKVDEKRVLIYIMRKSHYKSMDRLYRDSKAMIANFNINNKTIVAFGETDVAPANGALQYITDVAYLKGQTSYTCFAGVDYTKVLVHQNIESTFKCIMDRLNKPKYLLILLINEKQSTEFNLKQKES